MKERLDKFLINNGLRDENDIDALVEMSGLVRELIALCDYEGIRRIIIHTVESGCYEAFTWCMELLQEEFENAEGTLTDFKCLIGRNVPGFDEFIERLKVDFKACTNGFEKVFDKNGEVESFFNILVYGTAYDNIRLISMENFDTKDNDYVQYKLAFFR